MVQRGGAAWSTACRTAASAPDRRRSGGRACAGGGSKRRRGRSLAAGLPGHASPCAVVPLHGSNHGMLWGLGRLGTRLRDGGVGVHPLGQPPLGPPPLLSVQVGASLERAAYSCLPLCAFLLTAHTCVPCTPACLPSAARSAPHSFRPLLLPSYAGGCIFGRGALIPQLWSAPFRQQRLRPPAATPGRDAFQAARSGPAETRRKAKHAIILSSVSHHLSQLAFHSQFSSITLTTCLCRNRPALLCCMSCLYLPAPHLCTFGLPKPPVLCNALSVCAGRHRMPNAAERNCAAACGSRPCGALL